jgi:hypothetical protein
MPVTQIFNLLYFACFAWFAVDFGLRLLALPIC